MDKTDQELYEEIYALTSSPEWETLAEVFEERLDSVASRAIDAADIETLYYLKGQRDVLREIVYLRDTYKAQERSDKEAQEYLNDNGLSI